MIESIVKDLETEEVVEGRVVHLAKRPITFAEFLRLTGEDDDVELVNGVLVEKMAAQLEYEKLFAWLFRLTGDYVEKRDLGVVLGSRTAVEISAFGGRLPDILFVRRERLDIVQRKAIYGAPDLVIELVSPNDRPSDIIALETDYRRIGVSEILFIDSSKQRLRLLRKQPDSAEDYSEQELTEGQWASATIEGLRLSVGWLLREPRPAVFDTLQTLLAES